MSGNPDKAPRTVGQREGIAAGVIAMGVLTVFLPGAVTSIVDPAQALMALWGMNVLFGVFIIAMGIAVIRARE